MLRHLALPALNCLATIAMASLASFSSSFSSSFSASAFGQTPAPAHAAGDWQAMRSIVPEGYVCGRAASVLKIDGRLDEPSWQHAAWTKEFVDIEGSRKPRPHHPTRAKMLWDDECFYIAAQLDEPHVWGTLKEHDAVIFQDNDFEVFIDPDGDNHQYYEFEMNALNTTWDLFLPRPYKDGGSADNSLELAGIRTAVYVDGTLNDPSDTDRGWSVEIAIPWTALARHANRAVPPRPGDTWRVDFSRVEWQHTIEGPSYKKVPGTKEDNWVWSPQGIIDMHRPERWGFVQFSSTVATESSAPAQEFSLPADLVARDWLMEIYHRQRVYQKLHGKWATSLEELSKDWLHKFESDVSKPRVSLADTQLHRTESGFEATTILTLADGSMERWCVREDSKLWRASPNAKLTEALRRAGDNADELKKALAGVNAFEREGMEFLIENMPDRDLTSLKSDFLIENVRQAYATWKEVPWGKAIPKDIFLNNVLPYANINERRDNWRSDFKKRFQPLIEGAKNASHATALLNQKLYPLVNVRYSTARRKADQSPYESINSGLASCTGLSVLLIDACRANGIPARFVGTPLWSDGSGNHSWLEIWDEGWHFTGAAEPSGDELDKAWFIDRASTAKRDEEQHAIYAVSFARTPLKFPMVWARDSDYIYAVNVTDRYTQLSKKPPEGSVMLRLRVTDQHTGQRVRAQLTITDSAAQKKLFEGRSNDERFDANDHIGTYLTTGTAIEITAVYESRTKTIKSKVPDSPTTITIDLE